MTTSAGLIEQIVSVGILIIGLSLGTLTFFAWRRERDRVLLIVTVAYSMFALRGGIVIFEEFVPVNGPEILDHLSSILVLVGLVVFFVALNVGLTNGRA